MTVDECRRYRRYVELGVKLWTGNQVKLNNVGSTAKIAAINMMVLKLIMLDLHMFYKNEINKRFYIMII